MVAHDEEEAEADACGHGCDGEDGGDEANSEEGEDEVERIGARRAKGKDDEKEEEERIKEEQRRKHQQKYHQQHQQQQTKESTLKQSGTPLRAPSNPTDSLKSGKKPTPLIKAKAEKMNSLRRLRF